MKKIQSGQGVTDLGSIDEASGIDRMGRGETPTGAAHDYSEGSPVEPMGEAEGTLQVEFPPLETSTSWGDPSPRSGERQDVWFEGGTTPVGRDDHRDILITIEGLPPDTTVTFTGRAAEQYRGAKAAGLSDEAAFIHAEAVQKMIDAPFVDFSQRFEPGVYTEAGIQHDGDPDLSAIIAAKREEIIAKDPSLAPMFAPGPKIVTTNDQGNPTIVEDFATGEMVAIPHTCTFDDFGEDSDCLACNPAAAEREPTPEEFSDPKNWHPVEGSYLTEPPTVTEVDEVNHPAHYNSHPSGIECIEITRWMMFDPGNALKYVMRLGLKGSARDDADKARFYLEDALGHCDRIWGILDFINFGDQIDEAKKRLFQVAEAEPDFIKAMFYHALYEGRMERALRAVNALLERYE